MSALVAGSGIPAEVAERSERALAEYAKLHRRILDPDDQSVAKRYLVVRSSHGLSNTQIEEARACSLPRPAQARCECGVG